MKKSLSIISSALLLSAMLAACNTDTEQPTNTSANETTEAESTKTETATTEATEETVNEQTAEQGEQPSGDTTSSEKTELTYTSKGEAVTEKTITSTSDELGYSISHLESYTLESEEPGVDHLFSNADDALSMQIKVASTEETTFDDMSASTKETITVIASEGNYEEVDLTNVKAATPSINNVIGYETVLDSEKITIVTFEKGAKIITLTIYDTEEADLTDAFLNMGLTIQ